MSEYLPIAISALALVISILAWRAPKTKTTLDDRALAVLRRLLELLEAK